MMRHIRRWARWLAERLEQLAQDPPVPLTEDQVEHIRQMVALDHRQRTQLRGLFAMDVVKPTVDPLRVASAVRHAYNVCGQSPDQWGLETDIRKTGKLFEILHYACIELGLDRQVQTVGDLVDVLTRALEKP